ncbi:MAG: hypothetical protein IPK50_03000 [Fibrobacterota bacterium]|nr:MAG: hypothetical protein IPK50_03000 [Fibrobacterota bacterium]
MIRSSVCTFALISIPFALVGCDSGGSTAAPPAEPTPQARLLVDESSDTVRIRLDSSALEGVAVQADLRVGAHPWSPDSVRLRKVSDHWELVRLPDGPWRFDATLRDREGMVVATGSKSFVRATPFTLCGHNLTLGEWVGLLGGNLVVVAGMDEGARSGRDVVKEILAAMVVSSLDVDRLSRLQRNFSNGVYSYGADPSRVETQFAFVAAQAFGPYAAGDTIRENVANTSSYVKNIGVSLTKGVTWDRGGLFDLILGSVSFSGRTPSFSIDPTRLSLTLATQAQITRPRRKARVAGDSLIYTTQTSDSLRFRISLVPTTLRALQNSMDDGTLTFSHDGTTYKSEADGMSHIFHHSSVRLYNDSLGLGQFDGSYRVDAASGAFKYYQRGVISSTTEQSTLFACDEALKDTLGVAHHAKDLSHGSFVTSRGLTIPYGLQAF